MEESTVWWLAAGALVAAELLTGSFYLLMLAVGLVAAALTAHAGVSLTVQIAAAAVVGGGAVIAWHLVRSRGAARVSARADRSVNLDVGETLLIDHWNPDGTAQVKYRGTTWTAVHRPGVTPSTGMHRVSELIGNRLLVDPV